ncbi:hypothetical protein PHLGIDRAFT_17770 [Phlebiopsis gigantea 11061_1 CR5-6]|uniref:Uncharacterized protein n=1 Tax=Phlebiopsis gigantea (strain 11061_1 CR5-6) TaxID=745531 RepID=A0A0C3S6N5_PHLG1|nr:hypothetical protein PHLGIDRAFT_17770 [Phlebiopsis gigantea 11061_1 CR5-6]
MLSVQHQAVPQRAHIPLHVEERDTPKDVELNELGDLQDAVEPFAKLISRSGRSVRLHCIVPTTIQSCDTFVDAQDLHELRSRSLVFVHDLVECLRSRGIATSYRLQPSNCSLCVVCALPSDIDANKVKTAALAAVENLRFQLRQKAFMADLEDGLALVIT